MRRAPLPWRLVLGPLATQVGAVLWPVVGAVRGWRGVAQPRWLDLP